ncbi:MAG: YkgJ family cysteine cluster protein [Alphaproteobacteria bacterium]|jgi:uncharacterized protein|nr:YkgJ family cysteine cluster protein [Alphaproteobacteria bacterium]MBT4084817.1 YkgJ family cysteine cluster protein [Alphaproteobacteria bacterium]MBT4544773.1 YkgJ family cysteine cluster protein [Alphaproteobacteria bacterium]MBT5919856.1 YkgJ family cysteine cluster protein [Alphaproteobacteria bacterium]MBT6386041.1 YkgJ family cysteine cluster protein [Alphaproteobacteria bacterium]
MPRQKPPSISYNCDKCPGYCCSYVRICVTPDDVRRLAAHFDVSEEDAASNFTREGYEENEIILRHEPDEHFGTACRFLDQEERRCTIYEARPEACREFPGVRRCGYYDFLSFERRCQENPDYISTTNNTE